MPKGKRTIYVRVDRLLNCIEEDPRYADPDVFLEECNVLSKQTLERALDGTGIQEKKAVKLAEHFGKDADYLIDRAPLRDESVAHTTNLMREILIGRMVRSELSVFRTSNLGIAEKTNLFEEATSLGTHPSLLGYAVGIPEALHTCKRLSRDGWSIRESDRVYRVKSFDRQALEEVIEHRVGEEMIQVRRAIRHIIGSTAALPNGGFQRTLVRRLRERRDVCEANLRNGLGFREADHDFHQAITENPDIKGLICRAVCSADQPYMKRRSLLKLVYGGGSSQYTTRIETFNKKQLADLEAIIAEFKSRRPRHSEIERVLIAHASRQYDLLDEIDDLIALIRANGDLQGVAAAL